MARVIEALVFDLDGVLIDSEQVWDEVRESYARENGGRWRADAQTDMMAVGSIESSSAMSWPARCSLVIGPDRHCKRGRSGSRVFPSRRDVVGRIIVDPWPPDRLRAFPAGQHACFR